MMKKLGELSIGSKIADINCPHIILLLAGLNLPGYPGAVCLSENVVRLGCFDAREPKNPDFDCARYGNNHYPVSNIHQWLNADENDWFKPAHEYDAPPVLENIFNGDDPYEDEPGFLTAFSDVFKKGLTTADIRTCRTQEDGAVEVTKAKVWLLSGTEIGFDKSGAEGCYLPLFDLPETKVAFNQMAGWPYFNPTDGWPYFLRSRSEAFKDSVRLVNRGGGEAHDYAYHGYNGIRPAFLLKSDLPVAKESGNAGLYLTGISS